MMGLGRRWGIGRWLPLLVWMGLIYFVSNQPKTDIPDFGFWDTLLKKGGHFLSYAVLAWLAWRVTRVGKRPFLWAFLITAAYAIGDEYHQSFVPGRHGQLTDVLIDCAGGLVALSILQEGRWRRLIRFWSQRRWSRQP